MTKISVGLDGQPLSSAWQGEPDGGDGREGDRAWVVGLGRLCRILDVRGTLRRYAELKAQGLQPADGGTGEQVVDELVERAHAHAASQAYYERQREVARERDRGAGCAFPCCRCEDICADHRRRSSLPAAASLAPSPPSLPPHARAR